MGRAQPCEDDRGQRAGGGLAGGEGAVGLVVCVAIIGLLRRSLLRTRYNRRIMAFVVVLVTFVAYLLNTWALRHVEASVVGTFIYLQPILAMLISVVYARYGQALIGRSADYVERIGMGAIGAHERALLDYATARVAEIGGLRVIGTAREKGAILSFVVDGFTAGEVGSHLDRHGVAVRSGHHCALPAMRRFGIEGTARASFALYNDREDVDQLIEALRALRR